MNSKWDAIRGNLGFFITMAVSLLVIGVCGYFLLFDREEATPTTPAVEETPVAAPAPEIRVPEPVETPVVEEITPVIMPSEEVSVPVQQFVPDDTPVVAEAPNLIVAPLEGEVVSAFSVDALVYNPTLEDWRIHDGVDIAAEEGSSVLAAGSGTVIAVEDDPLMGITVTLSHEDGTHTTYSNLQTEVPVHPGDVVSAGQIIGAVGRTAAAEADQPPHLHFSVTRNGDVIDPDVFLAS